MGYLNILFFIIKIVIENIHEMYHLVDLNIC